MGKLNRGRDYLRVGGRRGLSQSRLDLPQCVGGRRGLFSRLELQKGGCMGSRRRTVIGLDHRLGPTHKKCGRASYSEVQQGFDLLWVQVTTSAECKKVSRYSLFREGVVNATGKEPNESLINL
jgi:hypothetical protein